MTNVNVEISDDHKMPINKGYLFKIAIARKSVAIICISQRLKIEQAMGNFIRKNKIKTSAEYNRLSE